MSECSEIPGMPRGGGRVSPVHGGNVRSAEDGALTIIAANARIQTDKSLDNAPGLTTIVSTTIDDSDQRPIYVHQEGEYGYSGRSAKLRRLVPIHTGNHPKSFDENMRCNTT